MYAKEVSTLVQYKLDVGKFVRKTWFFSGIFSLFGSGICTSAPYISSVCLELLADLVPNP